MPVLKVENVAEHGINHDLLPFQLPANAWTSGTNIRFTDNKMSKFKGHATWTTPTTNWDNGSDQVYYLLPVEEAGTFWWVYCGLDKVYVYNHSTSTHTDITRAAGIYTGSAGKWTGGIIGGVPVLNNGTDEPQAWKTVSAGTPLTNLSADGWPASAKCGAMRVYKNYLVAMDVTDGTRNQNLVKWSDSAALGVLPQSWDEADNTTDAGEISLEDSVGDTNSGSVIDGLQLRDAFIVYKDNSTWSMNFVGGSQIFQFRKIFGTKGMMTNNCVQEFNGNHFVVGNADVWIHNGQSSETVIDNKNREYLFGQIDGNNYQNTFVYHDTQNQEMWICYPVVGDFGLPTQALIWNYNHNTWSHRDLPGDATFGTGHIENGLVDTSSAGTGDLWSSGEYTGTHDGAGNAATLADSTAAFTVDALISSGTAGGKMWAQNVTDDSIGEITDNDATTVTAVLSGGTDDDWDASDSYIISKDWESWTTDWGSTSFTPQASSPLIGADKLYKGNDGNTFAGTNINVSVSRTDIPIAEQGEIVRIKRVYPRISGNMAVDIRVGAQIVPGGAVDYQNAVSFNPATDTKVDVRKTGSHAVVEFSSSGNQEWDVSGYDIEYELVGRRAKP